MYLTGCPNMSDDVQIIDWNIAHRDKSWHLLSDSDADLALLQEAGPPMEDFAAKFDVYFSPWQITGDLNFYMVAKSIVTIIGLQVIIPFS